MKNTNIESSHGKNKKGILALFVVGLSLALFPPLIISVSRKYEHLVGLGNAYSVVFVQIFGVALLLSLFFLEVSNLSILQKKYFSFFFVKNKMLPFYFLSFLYATVFAATVPANLERILSYNKTWEVVERKQMEQILSAGFLDTVPSENSIVVVRHPYLWESGLLPPFDKKRREVCTAFFTLYAKRPLHCVTTDSLKNKEIVFPQVPADHIFIFEREVVDGNIERAILYNDATRSIAVRRHHKGRDFYVFSYEKGRFAIPPLFVK